MCQDKGRGFCNFDDGNSGVCEYCSDVNGSCKDDGFKAVRGVDECEDKCEGIKNLHI